MSQPSNPSSQTEVTQLHTRIAELEQALNAAQEREQALRESETRLRYIVEGSDDGAWDWNMVTNEAFLSPRWFEIFGYEPNELPNNADTWIGSIHPDEVPDVLGQLQDYIEGRSSSFESENRMRHKSGNWLWTLSRGKIVVRDDGGQPVRMTGTVRDISARKQVIEDLAQSQRLLQEVIDHSPAVIYVRDTTFRYLLVNRNHAALFGKETKDIIGKRDDELFPSEVIETFRTTDRFVLEQGRTVTTEEITQHPDGPHIYISVKFPLFDDQGKLYAFGGISTDITEERRTIQERAALQEQIIAVQRAALLELSTPLIPIAQGILIMPLIGSVDGQRAQQVLETLLNGVASHHAATVILDITGVQLVDTYVARVLVQATQAVKLLGAQVIVTGIRPEIAQTIVDMGAELNGLLTYGTLQNGIAYALKIQDGDKTKARLS